MKASATQSWPPRSTFRSKVQHVCDSYGNWSAAEPERRKVPKQPQLSERLIAETQAVGAAPFAELERMAEQAAHKRILRDIPQELITSAKEALALATMELTTGAALKRPATGRPASICYGTESRSLNRE